MKQTIKEKIKQRRRQMLVHSYLYYEEDTNIISDSDWSKWAVELAELQKKYPKESAEVEYADQFKDWDGSSGAFLKYDEAIIGTAHRLLSIQFPNLKFSAVSNDRPEVKKSPIKKKVKSNTKSLF